MTNLSRLLDEPYFDQKAFDLHLANNLNPIESSSLNNDELPHCDLYWIANGLVNIVGKNYKYNINYELFLERLIGHIETIERHVLDIIYYEYNEDDHCPIEERYSSFSVHDKIKDCIECLDEESGQCFVDYLKDKDLIKLIKIYYSNT